MKTSKGNEIIDELFLKKIQEQKEKRAAQVKSMLFQQDSMIKDENRIIMIPIDKIKPDPNNARKYIDDKKLGELAESIRKHGVKQPIIVTENKDEKMYEIICGERRWRACALINLSKIPAIIETEVTPLQKLLWGLIENVQRVDITEVERARQIAYIREAFPDMTFEEIGKELGFNKARISQFVKISKLPEDVQDMIEEIPGITERHIRAINNINKISEEKAKKVAAEMKANPMSGEEIIAWANQIIREYKTKDIAVKKTKISYVLTRLHSRLNKIEDEWPETNEKKKLLYKNELVLIKERIDEILKLK